MNNENRGDIVKEKRVDAAIRALETERYNRKLFSDPLARYFAGDE